jgi:GNAT superfamily N-acetyltransferase
MEMYKVTIRLPIDNWEVPQLRSAIGWGSRELDYPAVFERCNFWAGARDEQGTLIAFGYICGMGLEHGYLEDIMVHPNYQKKGIGVALIRELLNEAERFGLGIITVSLEEEHANFYQTCGFTIGSGGVLYLK